MMLLALAGGNRVLVIMGLVQADEDTVREVMHRFNMIGNPHEDAADEHSHLRLATPRLTVMETTVNSGQPCGTARTDAVLLKFASSVPKSPFLPLLSASVWS